jgi:hypothetical protein
MWQTKWRWAQSAANGSLRLIPVNREKNRDFFGFWLRSHSRERLYDPGFTRVIVFLSDSGALRNRELLITYQGIVNPLMPRLRRSDPVLWGCCLGGFGVDIGNRNERLPSRRWCVS